MKPRINYRAERADRTRKKAAKKEARLARSQTPSDETAPREEAEKPSNDNKLPESK